MTDTQLPPELRGTYAERLAIVRADAEHALWAVQHGADWPAGWRACPRLDWLLEAWMLAACGEGGGDAHRLVVGWLAVESARAFEEQKATMPADWFRPRRQVTDPLPVASAIHAAHDFAARWSRREPGGPPDIVAFSVTALFPSHIAAFASTSGDRSRAVAAAALRTAYAALDPMSIPAAGRALSVVEAGSHVAPELVARFVEAFEAPAALRCELPS